MLAALVAVAGVASPPPPLQPLLHCVPVAPPPSPPRQDDHDYHLDANLMFVLTSLLFFAPMAAFIVATLSLCYHSWLDDQKERRRISNFMGTAQFYEYQPRKNVLLSPAASAEIYEQQPLELDSAGEPLSLTGERLYPGHVATGAPSPPPAQNAAGGGRLQMLWLAKGAGGAGMHTRAGERRLATRAAERSAAAQADNALGQANKRRGSVKPSSGGGLGGKQQGGYQKLQEYAPPQGAEVPTGAATSTRGADDAAGVGIAAEPRRGVSFEDGAGVGR